MAESMRVWFVLPRPALVPYFVQPTTPELCDDVEALGRVFAEDRVAVFRDPCLDALLQPGWYPRVDVRACLCRAYLDFSGWQHAVAVEERDVADSQAGVDRDADEVLDVLAVP